MGLEDDLREALRVEAAQHDASSEIPRGVINRARLMRAGYVVVAVLALVALVAVPLRLDWNPGPNIVTADGDDVPGEQAGSGTVAAPCRVLLTAAELVQAGRDPSSVTAWIEDPRAQDALERVNEIVDSQFPSLDAALAAGIIGVVPNHEARTVYLIYDPIVLNPTNLLDQMRAVADGQFPIAGMASCNSSSDLLSAHQELSALSADPALKGSVALAFDPHESAFQVALNRNLSGAEEVRQDLEQRLGSLVDVTLEEPADTLGG